MDGRITSELTLYKQGRGQGPVALVGALPTATQVRSVHLATARCSYELHENRSFRSKLIQEAKSGVRSKERAHNSKCLHNLAMILHWIYPQTTEKPIRGLIRRAGRGLRNNDVAL